MLQPSNQKTKLYVPKVPFTIPEASSALHIGFEWEELIFNFSKKWKSQTDTLSWLCRIIYPNLYLESYCRPVEMPITCKDSDECNQDFIGNVTVIEIVLFYLNSNITAGIYYGNALVYYGEDGWIVHTRKDLDGVVSGRFKVGEVNIDVGLSLADYCCAWNCFAEKTASSLKFVRLFLKWLDLDKQFESQQITEYYLEMAKSVDPKPNILKLNGQCEQEYANTQMQFSHTCLKKYKYEILIALLDKCPDENEYERIKSSVTGYFKGNGQNPFIESILLVEVVNANEYLQGKGITSKMLE